MTVNAYIVQVRVYSQQSASWSNWREYGRTALPVRAQTLSDEAVASRAFFALKRDTVETRIVRRNVYVRGRA